MSSSMQNTSFTGFTCIYTMNSDVIRFFICLKGTNLLFFTLQGTLYDRERPCVKHHQRKKTQTPSSQRHSHDKLYLYLVALYAKDIFYVGGSLI
jgi:hypothetical protein